MKTLPLLLVLVAGVAGAQPGPTNCRSAAHACNVYSLTVWGGTAMFNGPLVSRTNSVNVSIGTASNEFFGVTGSAVNVGVGGVGITLNTAAASNAITITNAGAWLDFGGSVRMKGDGTNILLEDPTMPVSDDAVNLGGAGNQWQRAFVSRGIVLGTGRTWSTFPLTDNTQSSSQLLYNASSGALSYRNGSRSNNEVGGEKDWAFEKRALRLDVGMSNTNCPVGAPSIRGTGAAAVTIACTDAAAATSATVDNEPMRAMNTTAVDLAVSLINLSGDVTQLQFGPRLKQHVYVPTGSTSNVRHWVALVPTATSLTGVDTGAISVMGFRYSTAAGDATWKACTGNGAAVTCVDTGQNITTNRDIELEVDCREVIACRFLIDGSLVASQTTPANLPTTTTTLGMRLLVQAAGAAAAKTLGVGRGALETN